MNKYIIFSAIALLLIIVNINLLILHRHFSKMIRDSGEQISKSKKNKKKKETSQLGDNTKTTQKQENLEVKKRKNDELGDEQEKLNQEIIRNTVKEALKAVTEEVTRNQHFKEKVLPEMYEKVKRRYFRRKISPEVYEKQKQRETRQLFRSTVCPEIYEKIKQRETRRIFRRTILPDMLEKMRQKRQTKQYFKSFVRPELLKTVARKQHYREAILPQMIERVAQRETKIYFKRLVIPDLKQMMDHRINQIKLHECLLLLFLCSLLAAISAYALLEPIIWIIKILVSTISFSYWVASHNTWLFILIFRITLLVFYILVLTITLSNWVIHLAWNYPWIPMLVIYIIALFMHFKDED
mmetsp:Transcript_13629/g.20649  ORF Transcript_13629/g.20649 Transcript_13629/m.20649 type:complete len:354 (+) Transcript_13629:60-1121(+)